MVITMAGQLRQLAIMMIFGFLLALTYDFIRLFRRIVPHGNFYIAVEDLLFWLCSAVISFLLVFWLNYGQIRLFMFLGISIGAVVYCVVISRIFLKISTLAAALVLKTIYILLYPFRVTAGTVRYIFEYFVNFLKLALKKYSKYVKIKSVNIVRYIAVIFKKH